LGDRREDVDATVAQRVDMKLLKILGFVMAALAGLFLLAYLLLEPPAEVPATVASDPTLPRVVLEGVPFHSEVFGQPTDPVVIILHGGPGGDYRSLRGLRSLADHGYQVVFYDQLGSGLSPRVPAEELTLQGAIDDLDRLSTTSAKESRWRWSGIPGRHPAI
jgi:proline iminopeptidase